MNIRKKLTIQFVIIVASIFILASVAIYFFSARYRQEDFYKRLHAKSLITTKMLVEVDEISAPVLEKIEKNNPVNLPSERIRIYNYKNELLYSSDKNNVLPVNAALLDKIRLKDHIRFSLGRTEVLGYLYKDRYDHLVVIIGAEDVYGMKKINNLKLLLPVVFSISILITFMFGWIYAGRAVRPIKKVIDKVNEISIKSLNLRVDEGNGHDEISQLAITFNDMISRLEKSFKIQENFIANASHELRTPLTAISGQLEVVMLREREPEDYRKIILSVHEEINNLVHISNRLLILAQASSENTIKDFKPVRIDELIWQAKSELIARCAGYTIDIDIMLDIDTGDQLVVHGSDNLLKVAITNLMENGCKFSEDHTVFVKINNISNAIQVQFKDYGVGIPSEDQPNILAPFHRGRNVLQVKGHGIGLSLVDMITRIHRGKLTFSSEVNEGSSFVITIPLMNLA